MAGTPSGGVAKILHKAPKLAQGLCAKYIKDLSNVISMSASPFLGELLKLVDKEGFEKLSVELQKSIEDLTTLTITTKGDDGKQLETKIRLTGDIETTTKLTDDEKLGELHERMMKEGIRIMKLYAEIVIQVISIFLPWAGIKVDLGQLEAVIKAFHATD
jgi:hypothetical protein